jgi:hypothetical protein
MRIGMLWTREHAGLYSNAPFDELFAYIGHNNGNLAFVHAIQQHVQGEIGYYPWHTPPAVLRDEVDLLVMPCANQLGKHTDLGALGRTLDAAEVPVVAIGLGAQASSTAQDVELTPGTAAWLQTLARLRPTDAPNIYVRGPYTERQVHRLGVGGVVMGGCPSLFINPRPDLGQRLQAAAERMPRTLCVAAAHQSWAKCATIEQQLVSMVSDSWYPGSYVPQSMADMIKISREEFDTIEPEVLDQIRRFAAPHLSPEVFQDWCRQYARSFYDVPSWMDHLRRYDLTVGARYHGVALALQAERMGLTITVDSRTEELCQQTGVPYVSAEELTGPVTRSTLHDRVRRFDGTAYDELRASKAATYVDFLAANGITPAPYLYGLAQRPVPAPVAVTVPAQASAPVAVPA